MRILVIVPPERRDFYSYLEEDKENEYVLLWHESEKKFRVSEIEAPPFFNCIFFWNQFLTPHRLIKRIKPDKIVFFEIIDLRQIALIVAANSINLPTIFIDHGAAGDRETAIKRWDEEIHVKNIKSYLVKRFITDFRNIVAAKIFYYSVFKFESIKSWIKYVLLPLKMLKNLPNKVLSHSVFTERNPRTAIIFSHANFEEFDLYTKIKISNVKITGVPDFDKYFLKDAKKEQHIVFIDHPYLEEQLMGWDLEHHHKVALALFNFANKFTRKVYVKLHPRSNINYWEPFKQKNSYLEIVQHGDFIETYLTSSLIIGFSSSLLTGLICARKNIVNIGWHPLPQMFGVDFSATGLCHQSIDINDLDVKLTYWENNNLSIRNEEKYQDFLREYNYPFDGKATQRVLEAIHSL